MVIALALLALPPVAGAADLPVIAIRFGRHDSYDRLVLEWPMPVGLTITVKDGLATLRFERAGSFDTKRLNGLLPATMRPAAILDGGTALQFRLPAGEEIHDRSAGNLVVLDLVPVDGGHAATPPGAAAAASPDPPPTVAPPPQSPPSRQVEAAGPVLHVRRAATKEGSLLRFAWGVPVAATLFERNGFVWIVFDRLSAGRPAAGDLPPGIRSIPNMPSTILRIGIPAGTDPVPGRQGDDWTLTFRHGQAAAEPASLADRDGFYAVRDAARPIAFTDPDQGDLLLAVPLAVPARCPVPVTGRAGYQALPTLQGLLFRPESDRLRITIEPEGVGLSLLPADR